jgi:DNA-binding MarR family transcriptional regulator
VLYNLSAQGDRIRLSELAERRGINAPAGTRKVQQFEGQGFLLRRPDPSDA